VKLTDRGLPDMKATEYK